MNNEIQKGQNINLFHDGTFIGVYQYVGSNFDLQSFDFVHKDYMPGLIDFKIASEEWAF